MPEIKEVSVETLAPSQAADLCQLADLEACWENLRKTPSLATDVSDTREDLHGRQRATKFFVASWLPTTSYTSRLTFPNCS